jgi:acyl dehydratase
MRIGNESGNLRLSELEGQMARVAFGDLEELAAMVGQEVVVSDWLEVTQERIDKFADATGDHQWIHVDVERAPRVAVSHDHCARFPDLSLLSHFLNNSLNSATEME